MGSKLFPFKVDPFSEGRQEQFEIICLKTIKSDMYSVALTVEVEVESSSMLIVRISSMVLQFVPFVIIRIRWS